MSVLPVFFFQSKAFRSTTWKSLRTRVFCGRSKSACLYSSKEPKGSLIAARNGVVLEGDHYDEWHDAGVFVIECPRNWHRANHPPRNAILRTVDYEVLRG